ncbi:YolD-like family protein [Sediminibacillus terrae]|uniref:YolD-like family protein n=1 Tax=Sediminibacillus terrae TaxID=1562106 RepID=UPI001295C953|nr:YolD-like family protein [Sediminibacillus terrae]
MVQLNDRGNIKWEASKMMLPEHQAMLQAWYESEEDVEKPILSDDQVYQIERTLHKAMASGALVDIQYYEDMRIRVIDGQIRGIVMEQLEVETSDGIDYLMPSEIVDVSIG